MTRKNRKEKQKKSRKIRIRKGGNIIQRLFGTATNPLHQAASEGNTETVQALLDKGANIDEKNKDGYTPLHIAAQNGNTETVQALLERGADVNRANNVLDTPLHIAAKKGHGDIVELFLENGAVIDSINIYNKTPLNLAKNKIIVDLLNNRQYLHPAKAVFNNEFAKAAVNYSSSDEDDKELLVSDHISCEKYKKLNDNEKFIEALHLCTFKTPTFTCATNNSLIFLFC